MHVRRGEQRQAVDALRQLADRDQSPGAWVRLGAQLARMERFDDAIDAFKQGWWLHRRSGHRRRADVVSTLIDQVRAGQSPLAA